MRLRDLRALAVDYDRTLTDDALEPVPRAIEALGAARKLGLRVVVVSGRELPFLETRLSDVADALVAENGCLVQHNGLTRRLGPGIDLRDVLRGLPIDVEHGVTIASADASNEPLVREALTRAGIEASIVRNRDRIMVLPPGIDKAAGLLAALDLLGVAPEATAAAGDAENDIPMLQAASYGIAVANAVDELKVIADHVTHERGGHGVAEWILSKWLPAHGAIAT